MTTNAVTMVLPLAAFTIALTSVAEAVVVSATIEAEMRRAIDAAPALPVIEASLASRVAEGNIYQMSSAEMQPTPVSVFENNDAVIGLRLTVVALDKTRSYYDTSVGTDFEFYLKLTPEDADNASTTIVKKMSAGKISRTGGVGGPDGLVTIQMAAADLVVPGTRYYRLDAIAAGRTTIAFGPCRVVNV